MEQLLEFIGNHPYLWVGFAVVVVLLVKAEYEHRTNRFEQVSPVNAIRVINNSDNAVIVDVRDSGAYKKGHIKGAINVPLSQLKDRQDTLSPEKDAPVLVCCNSGATSSKASRMLSQAGYTNVHNIAGGINGWMDANLPVSKK
ncbi:MAG: rhodanese-like domain-containing protein [Gammaproteobacteria bacterium]|nr:rhodanese-like domain-containing protein [Gammaproteobacteria bacterium]